MCPSALGVEEQRGQALVRGVAGERGRKAVTWETPPGISLILEWIMKRVHKEQNSSTRNRLWSGDEY